MPKVPQLAEKQRIVPTNPTGFQSTRGFRIGGESISALGRGVSDVGRAILAEERKQTSVERALTIKEATAAGKRFGQDQQEELDRRNTDGTGDVDFVDKGFQRFRKQFLEQVPGKFQRDANIAIEEEQNLFRGKTFTNARKKRSASILKRTNNLNAASEALVRSNPTPENFTRAVRDDTELGTKLVEEGLIEESKFKDYVTNRTKILADQTIEGLMDQGEFTAARNLVNGSFARFYDTAQRDAQNDRIWTRQAKFEDDKWANETREDARRLREVEKEEEEQQTRFMVELARDDLSPEKYDILEDMAVILAAERKISFKGGSKLLREIDSRRDEESIFDLTREYANDTSPKNIKRLKDKVWKYVLKNRMSKKAGARFLNTLRNAAKRSAPKSREFQGWKTRLMSHFRIKKYEDLFDMTKAGNARAARALSDFILNFDQFGGEATYKKVVQEHFPDDPLQMGVIPIIGKPIQSQEDLTNFKSKARTLIKDNVMTPAQLRPQIKKAKEAEEMLRRKEELDKIVIPDNIELDTFFDNQNREESEYLIFRRD